MLSKIFTNGSDFVFTTKLEHQLLTFPLVVIRNTCLSLIHTMSCTHIHLGERNSSIWFM